MESAVAPFVARPAGREWVTAFAVLPCDIGDGL